jgi:hypothetical protein
MPSQAQKEIGAQVVVPSKTVDEITKLFAKIIPLTYIPLSLDLTTGEIGGRLT